MTRKRVKYILICQLTNYYSRARDPILITCAAGVFKNKNLFKNIKANEKLIIFSFFLDTVSSAHEGVTFTFCRWLCVRGVTFIVYNNFQISSRGDSGEG